MAFDGLILNSIVNELQILINGKVNRIFEPNNDEIILNIFDILNNLLFFIFLSFLYLGLNIVATSSNGNIVIIAIITPKYGELTWLYRLKFSIFSSPMRNIIPYNIKNNEEKTKKELQ